MRTSRFACVVLFAIGLCAVGSPAVADKGDMRFQFGLLYNTSTDQLDDMGTTTEVDDALGFQFSYEYMISGLFGIEPAFAWASHDVELEGGGDEFKFGEIDFRALTANLNFHVLRDKSVDFFVGPTIGYTFWSDLEGELFPGDFPVNDDFVYGVNLGVDVPFGSGKWSFTGGITYLVVEIELEDSSGPEIGFDPFQLKAGVSVHF